MDFRITGLDPSPFQPLYGLNDEQLRAQGVLRVCVDTPHSAPDRIELRDAEPGEHVLLLNHEYLAIEGSPYRGRHAIYVREGAVQRYDRVNEVPDSIRRRLMSLRAFDAQGFMTDADVAEGSVLEPLIERMLARPEVRFIQAHNARRGCYAATIERA